MTNAQIAKQQKQDITNVLLATGNFDKESVKAMTSLVYKAMGKDASKRNDIEKMAIRQFTIWVSEQSVA